MIRRLSEGAEQKRGNGGKHLLNYNIFKFIVISMKYMNMKNMSRNAIEKPTTTLPVCKLFVCLFVFVLCVLFLLT